MIEVHDFEIDNDRKSLKNDYSQYDWEWFVSLGFKHNKLDYIDSMVREWVRNMSKEDHIRVCYMGQVIFSNEHGYHVHLLMSGMNSDGITLRELQEWYWEKEWNKISHKSCKIKNIYNDKVFDYMILERNTPIGEYRRLQEYGEKMLKKIKR
jgi:hypothetical protein